MQRAEQVVNDTPYYVGLDRKQKNICVYNRISRELRQIPLNHIPFIPVYSIYFHNHDSIFLFFDRQIVCQNPENPDFVMIDKNGGLVDTYSLNDVSFIFKGSFHNSVFYSNDKMKNRIMKGQLLIPLAISDLEVFHPSEDFKNLPVMGLYDLQNHTCRMLNIRFPKEDIGKCYERNLAVTAVHSTWMGNGIKRLLVNYTHSPNIYSYDFEKDTMLLIGDSDCIFRNTDSASMKSDSSYNTYKFWTPEWQSELKVYTRTIQMHTNGRFGRTRVLQLLDTDFRSLGYLCENEHFYTPFYSNGHWVAQSKDDNHYYKVSISGKTTACSTEEFMKKTKPAAQALPEGKIAINMFFKNLGIPLKKDNIILLINVNYPCGHCLEYLLTEMQQHQKEYEAHGVYYVLLEQKGNDFTDHLLKQYGLDHAPNVIVDHRYYPTVVLNGKGIDDESYRFFLLTEKGAVLKISSAVNMPSDFRSLIKNEVLNKNSNSNE